MIPDMLSNKKLNPIVTELFVTGWKLNSSRVFFITPFSFAVPKVIRLNSIHCFIMKIMKIPNKRDLQQMVFNHSSDIGFKDFINLYKKCTAKSCSFLVTDATLASDNPLHLRKCLVEKTKANDNNWW